ncbi:MAG: tol-pal system protein YbgF [Mesorhizobium sp.]
MKLSSFVLAVLALPFAAGIASAAGDRAFQMSGQTPVATSPALLSVLPDMAGRASDQPEIRLAQSSDARVIGLEEQVRQLNGRIEEMNFQILQIQEQMRKMQEDVDFRLQEVEQKRGDAGQASGQKNSVASAEQAPAPSDSARQAEPTPPATQEAAPTVAGSGAPERQLGELKVDEKGNVTGGEIDLRAADDGAPDNEAVVAALPPSADNPGELYRDSYEHVLSGDYATAEAGFRKHIESYPADPQTSDARYWLGESLLGQQRYRDAVEVFIDASKQFPNSRKSPDMLLKLGVSLSALNQRDIACATFDKIGQAYPKAPTSLKQRVKQERALAGC